MAHASHDINKQPPSSVSHKADEALRLFATLQDTLAAERLQQGLPKTSPQTTTTTVNAATAIPSKAAHTHPPTSPKSGRTPLSFSMPLSPLTTSPPLKGNVTALRTRLEVADGIMRRLHAKNKQLLRRVAELETQLHDNDNHNSNNNKQQAEWSQGVHCPSENSHTNGHSSALVEALRAELRQRESEVHMLRDRLHHRLERPSRFTAQTPTPQTRRTKSTAKRRNGRKDEEKEKEEKERGVCAAASMELRARQAEAAYAALLKVKTEPILGGEAVANAEVRRLVECVQRKMQSEALRYEVELLLLRDRLREAEQHQHR